MLWTRVTPSPGQDDGNLEVAWQVSDDPSFAREVAAGVVETSAARDFTVKADAGGLEPGRFLLLPLSGARADVSAGTHAHHAHGLR